MVKKIITAGLIAITILAVLSTAVMCFFTLKVKEENYCLKGKLVKYEKEEAELNNMQEAVEVAYNLTPYEARYYSFIFRDFAKKYNLPWEVYPALVRIESNFNSGVMSKERAKGITQVLETTGKTQAEKLGIPFNDNTLWNCVLNMVIGFDFFSEGYAEKIDSASQESALKHAMKRYCGGPGYAKINPDAQIYVREYKSTLWDEYKRVSYVYKGIQFDKLMREDSLKQIKVANLEERLDSFIKINQQVKSDEQLAEKTLQ